MITVDGMPERVMWNIFTHLARLVAYPVIRRELGINGWEGDSGQEALDRRGHKRE